MELHEIVMKLVGPVDPVGETYTDNDRFENLKVLIDLVDTLVSDIDRIATYCKPSHQFSVKRAGEQCSKALDSLGISR